MRGQGKEIKAIDLASEMDFQAWLLSACLLRGRPWQSTSLALCFVPQQLAVAWMAGGSLVRLRFLAVIRQLLLCKKPLMPLSAAPDGRMILYGKLSHGS